MKVKDINLEELFEKIDWPELHKTKILHPSYNDDIIIWAKDASIEVLSSNTFYITDEYCLVMKTDGFGNADSGMYAEGWANEEKDENDNHTGNYIEIVTGSVMTREEMISEIIKEGEWSEVYECWKEKFRIDYKEDLRMDYEEDLINERNIELYKDL